MRQPAPGAVTVLTEADRHTAVPNALRPGDAIDCDACGARVPYERGLVWYGRNQTGLLVVGNLGGFRCPACSFASWDAPSYEAILRAKALEPPGFGAHAKVSRLAGRALGAYFPQALQKHMDLHAGDELVLQPIDGRFLLVEVRRRDEPEPERDS